MAENENKNIDSNNDENEVEYRRQPDSVPTQEFKKPQTPTSMQLILGLVANISVISPGMSLGFSAIALPTLTSLTNPNRLTADQGSWVASMASISMPIGCLLSGTLLDRLGRKFSLYIINYVMILGWAIISTASSDNTQSQFIQLLIGRFIAGIGTGLCSVPPTVYMSEISTPNLRGMVCTFSSIAFALGVLFIYTIGYCFKDNWQLAATISGIIPIFCIICIRFLITESPVWYQNKGRPLRAQNSIRKLQGFTKARRSVPIQFEQIIEQNQLLNQNEKSIQIIPARSKSMPASRIATSVYNETSIPVIERRTLKTKIMERVKYLLQPECLKPFVIMCTYFFFQQFSGIFVIIYYAVDIVKEAGIVLDPYLVAIMIGLVRTGVSMMVSYISKRFGRRPPSILSGGSMTICMVILALYLFLIQAENIEPSTAAALSNYTSDNLTEPLLEIKADTIRDILLEHYQWVPLVTLMSYFFASTFGFLTIPFAMIGEVYPTEIRGFAGGLTAFMCYTFSFIVVKLYPTMLAGFGRPGLFLFYSIMSFFGTVFVIMYLPETKGKTLQEIEEHFRGNKQLNNNVFVVESRNLVTDENSIDVEKNQYS
ncbi:solute carrier family 2, facilitated glucose transporter member 8-like [Chrysoperla carnea]|uniref:solute carrier family 2, facilitated glucose transporter member 8-like n=1 Tax=Chrysoperla carnea TaxID=189513 RepID=UPI001D07A074|nr:solute carrier family 2, facilitated glucose transporter member 8-like [Chrysoperla carnea]